MCLPLPVFSWTSICVPHHSRAALSLLQANAKAHLQDQRQHLLFLALRASEQEENVIDVHLAHGDIRL